MDKNTKDGIRAAAKINAEQVRRNWGAGWDRISREQQIDAIGMVCFMSVIGQVSGQVDVEVMRDIYNATIKYADVKEM